MYIGVRRKLYILGAELYIEVYILGQSCTLRFTFGCKIWGPNLNMEVYILGSESYIQVYILGARFVHWDVLVWDIMPHCATLEPTCAINVHL